MPSSTEGANWVNENSLDLSAKITSLALYFLSSKIDQQNAKLW